MKINQSKEPFDFFSFTESEICPLFSEKGRSESHSDRFLFSPKSPDTEAKQEE